MQLDPRNAEGAVRPAGMLLALLLVAGLLPNAWAVGAGNAPRRSGRALYATACAACHGVDGTGAPAEQVAFDLELPDFTDCSFASREPDADWVIVAHEGGPVRVFDEMMPAHGGVASVAELELILEYIRTFCDDPTWPSGDLNLPRAMFTEKAFPEDEAVLTTMVTADDATVVEHELVYETRLGAFTQVELKVPFGWGEAEGDGDWSIGLGDMAVAIKTTPLHSKKSGSVFAIAGELIVPTGDEDKGYGKGTAIFEPFLAYGQALPLDFFFHLQAGVEIPFDDEKGEYEVFWRGAFGRTFTEGFAGRAWSPMIEVLGKQEMDPESIADWDLVPQLQVTLNTRQHVMLNIAARLPVNDFEDRDKIVAVYLLWDWFDGGFFEGW